MIVHDQMWCVCSIAYRSNPKRFLSILYVFEIVFMLLCFNFLFKIHFFVLFFKKFFRGIFVRSSWLSTSRKKRLRQKLENTKFRQRLLQLSRNCFATKGFLRKVLCFKGVFQFQRADVIDFQTHPYSLVLSSSRLPQTQNNFQSKPHQFQVQTL